MKKRSIFCVLLTISMLLGSLGVFSSCAAKDGEVKLSGKAELDLSEYAVVYAESEQKTATFKTAVTDFTQKVIALTGKRIAATPEARATEQGKEILIGDTSRAQTQKAQKRIKGDGFIIEVTDHKIVILGTSHVFLVMAMEYFADKYLPEATDKTISIHKRALAKNLECIVVDESLEQGIALVCEAGLATDAASGRDLPAKVADDFWLAIGDNLFTSKKTKANLLHKKDPA